MESIRSTSEPNSARKLEIDAGNYHLLIQIQDLKPNSSKTNEIISIECIENYLLQMPNCLSKAKDFENGSSISTESSPVLQHSHNHCSSFDSSMSGYEVLMPYDEQTLTNEWKRILRQKACLQKEKRQIRAAQEDFNKNAKAILHDIISCKLGIDSSPVISIFPLYEEGENSTFSDASSDSSPSLISNQSFSSLPLNDMSEDRNSIDEQGKKSMESSTDKSKSTTQHNSKNQISADNSKTSAELVDKTDIVEEILIADAKENIKDEAQKPKENSNMRRQNRWITVPNLQKLIPVPAPKLTPLEKEKKEFEQKMKNFLKDVSEFKFNELQFTLKENELEKKMKSCEYMTNENRMRTDKLTMCLKKYLR